MTLAAPKIACRLAYPTPADRSTGADERTTEFSVNTSPLAPRSTVPAERLRRKHLTRVRSTPIKLLVRHFAVRWIRSLPSSGVPLLGMKLFPQFEVSERNQHTSFIQLELDNASLLHIKNVNRFVLLTVQ